jgi:hypothetical protein
MRYGVLLQTDGDLPQAPIRLRRNFRLKSAPHTVP